MCVVIQELVNCFKKPAFNSSTALNIALFMYSYYCGATSAVVAASVTSKRSLIIYN